MRVLSANTISATLVSGTKRWLLLGTYLNPSDDPDDELDILETEFRRHPSLPVILLGDLNTDINDTTDARSIPPRWTCWESQTPVTASRRKISAATRDTTI